MAGPDSGSGEDAKVDVVVVGAGLSGIGAACHLARDRPGTSVLVLEARERLGGTWDLFRYPGVRSDSDMFTMAYAFAPWQRPDAIADGEQVLTYLRETAAAYGVTDRIRYSSRVVAADFSSADARWRLRIERPDGGTRADAMITCRFLWSCTGYYRYDNAYAPELDGRAEFSGPVVHPQHWPSDLEVAGRRVVVLGSGATAVSLVPALVEAGADVTVLQRSPTYLASVPSRYPLLERLRHPLLRHLAGRVVRARGIALQTSGYAVARAAPRLSRGLLLAHVRRRLPPKTDPAGFVPRYRPWDQRLGITPDDALFRALASGRARVVTDVLERLTPTGLRLVSGTELGADVLVTATGLELLGLGGIELSVDGVGVDVGARPTYRGVLLAGVPNLAFCVGYVGAAWTLRVDVVARYVTRLLRRMERRGFTSVTPVPPADPGVHRPLLDLRSGYVRRGAGRLPGQGTRHPWVVRQNPVRERLAFRLRPLTTGLRFERGAG